MRLQPIIAGLGAVVVFVTAAGAAEPEVYRGHGIAMHGDLKYGPDFAHFDYVNPAAPKGGEMKQAAIGTFDSFNPFVLRGTPAAGIGEIYDTLMAASADEPFSEYGLLAETIETPADRSWVAFTLRKEARWHDGEPVTADDVIWTFETLRSKGNPFYRGYYASVDKVEKLDQRKVRFSFKPGQNRELPLILGQLVVLPQHYWKDRDFEKSTLDPPLGSGPYRVDRFEAGRWVAYKRVEDYWGEKLAVNVGRNNPDVKRYDYYRDDTVALEAFKAGAYDLRVEISAKDWATAYDVPALRDGSLRKEEIANERPAGMQAFAYNIRRPLFQDPRVRQALAYAFDFEWSNKNLFYGQYTRTRSYFDNSELAAKGLPSKAELEILQPYRGRVPDEVFTREYQPPSTDGAGGIRANLQKAVELLRAAGWEIDEKSRKLTNRKTGQVMAFELLLVQPAFERVALPFAKNLERLGVEARVRTVDTSQYQRRTDDFDFDMIVGSWPQSMSPGNEQRNYWGSEYAKQTGSQNAIGIAAPVVDELIEKIISAPDRASLVTCVHALDRVLQWGHYLIPNWHLTYDRIAYWSKFEHPAVTPAQGAQLDAWWIDQKKEAGGGRQKAGGSK
jgi:microcin C transport system substrate-binding protein